jgi:RNA polymerase sigma-70 factor (ECF subfamily)
MQEALIEVSQKIGQLRDTSASSFVTWIKAIGEVTLLKFMRSESAQKRGGQFHRLSHTADSVTARLVDLVDQLPGEATTGSRAAARREAIYALQVAIAGLPADQRKAITLHILQGMTLDDTAMAMNRTSSAIRGLVHRGKQNLAEAMGRASAWLSHR